MGVKGYTVYVFRNVYYIFEHEFDITPDDLGHDFVIKLKEDFLINRNTLVDPGDYIDLVDPEVIREEILYEQFDNEDTVSVTVIQPIIHDNIKWIYTANFDTKIFSVESSNYNTLYYNLLNIPGNWVETSW
jgi:hypothetical protein